MPIPIQLTGVTAVVFFCLSAIDVFNLSRVLWLNQEMIASLDTGNLVQLGTPLALFARLVHRFAVYLRLVRIWSLAASRRLAQIRAAARRCSRFAISFSCLRWSSCGWFPSFSFDPCTLPANMLAVGVGLRLFHGALFIGFLVKIWPHHVANAALRRDWPSERK